MKPNFLLLVLFLFSQLCFGQLKERAPLSPLVENFDAFALLNEPLRNVATSQTAQKIEILVTRGAHDFHRQIAGASFSNAPANQNLVIRVNPRERFQTMVGFGANLTESSTIVISRLPEDRRTEVMNLIFNKATGAGFDFIRMPLGSSDFADGSQGSYTYADSPELLMNVSAERDQKSIDLINAAKVINPDLQVMVSPWSAPAWMKENRNVNNGRLDPEHYQDYAVYLVNSLMELESRGLQIDYFSIVNEPGFATDNYPSMHFGAEAKARFIRDHLGPMMQQKIVKPLLLIHDHNWDQESDVDGILSTPGVAKYVGGIAYHGYGGRVEQMIPIAEKYPNFPIYQTEVSSVLLSVMPQRDTINLRRTNPSFWATHRWDNFFEFYVLSQLIEGPRIGAKSALSWNLALDENNGPRNGGWIGVGPAITLNSVTGEIRKNIDFIALYHASHFVDSGAHRIESTNLSGQGLHSVAFRNPDGSIVVVAYNKTLQRLQFALENGQGQLYPVTIESKALMTFKWK